LVVYDENVHDLRIYNMVARQADRLMEGLGYLLV
jgi:hypothetical protein